MDNKVTAVPFLVRMGVTAIAMLLIDYLLPGGVINALTGVAPDEVFLGAAAVIFFEDHDYNRRRSLFVSVIIAPIRETISRCIAILMRPDLQGNARKQERRALLREALYPCFDFEESSRRALGVHWKGRMPAEKRGFTEVFKEFFNRKRRMPKVKRKFVEISRAHKEAGIDSGSKEMREFVEIFKEILVDAYASKIEGYKVETIVFSQTVADLPYAELCTKIVMAKGEQIDVNYQILRNGDEWRICDFVIEGASLVDGYRSQFADILSRYSFNEMMRRLEKTAKAASAGG